MNDCQSGVADWQSTYRWSFGLARLEWAEGQPAPVAKAPAMNTAPASNPVSSTTRRWSLHRQPVAAIATAISRPGTLSPSTPKVLLPHVRPTAIASKCAAGCAVGDLPWSAPKRPREPRRRRTRGHDRPPRPTRAPSVTAPRERSCWTLRWPRGGCHGRRRRRQRRQRARHTSRQALATHAPRQRQAAAQVMGRTSPTPGSLSRRIRSRPGPIRGGAERSAR